MRHLSIRGKYCLSNYGRDEVAAAIDCLRQVCAQAWSDIYANDGLRPKYVEDHELPMQRPLFIDKGTRISYVRASQKWRIYGFRDGNVFFVLWFDFRKTIRP
jgi:hypothetical protein